LAVFTGQFPIYANFAALAQVADHVPVQGRLVDSKGLRTAGTQGEVNGSTHLLVEERIFCTAVDVAIIAKGKLAKTTRPFVHAQHLVQVVLAVGGTSLDRDTVLKTQAHIFDGATGKRGRETVADITVGRVLNGTGKDFTAGEIVMTIVINK